MPETSTRLSACQRSQALCMLSHMRGDPPTAAANLTAVSGVTGYLFTEDEIKLVARYLHRLGHDLNYPQLGKHDVSEHCTG